MIAHSLDELIIAVQAIDARVAAIDGAAPVMQTSEAAPVPPVDSLREEMTEAIAAINAKLAAMAVAPIASPVPISIDLAPLSDRMTAIEAAVREIRAARDTTPLVPVQIADHGARIEALEGHAAAHSELSDALALCLQMARESEARTRQLETEARATHATIATVMPALAAIARR